VDISQVVGTSAEIGQDEDWRGLVPQHRPVKATPATQAAGRPH